MEPLTEADLAWVAGVIDALANLRLRNAGGSPLPEIQVNGQFPALQDRLAKMTGTTAISTRRDFTRHNCTEHCPSKHAHIQSVSGRWSITGVRALVVLAAIRPYIRLRPGLVDDLIAAGMTAQWKGQTLRSMSALGWPLPERPADPVASATEEVRPRR